MGLEDIRTTVNLYCHLFDDREDELVAALDRRHDPRVIVVRTNSGPGPETGVVSLGAK